MSTLQNSLCRGRREDDSTIFAASQNELRLAEPDHQSPRNIHVVTSRPRRRGDPVSTEYPRRGRGVAATRLPRIPASPRGRDAGTAPLDNADKPSWQDEFPAGSLELPTASGRVHVVGNPGLFKLNETVVAVTATDVLFQLSSQELFVNGRDGSALATLPRVARLASHLLTQRSFYPLFPPPALAAAQAEAPVDLRQHAKWRLPVKPDVLIAPSKLQPFARDVGGCLVLNPGHLARGAAGGTFAQLTVHPAADKPEDSDDVRVAHDVPARARVEITRI